MRKRDEKAALKRDGYYNAMDFGDVEIVKRQSRLEREKEEWAKREQTKPIEASVSLQEVISAPVMDIKDQIQEIQEVEAPVPVEKKEALPLSTDSVNMAVE